MGERKKMASLQTEMLYALIWLIELYIYVAWPASLVYGLCERFARSYAALRAAPAGPPLLDTRCPRWRLVGCRDVRDCGFVGFGIAPGVG